MGFSNVDRKTLTEVSLFALIDNLIVKYIFELIFEQTEYSLIVFALVFL